ncbi:MAG: DUF2510 domain-containing protein [Acidimicrobiales bacterium]|jgi:hypothetical protein
MSVLSSQVLDLVVAAAIALSMVLGAVDLFRQPAWAWKAAGEPRVICLLLVLLLPGVGLAIYVFGTRPRIAAIAATGRAATLPFERFADRANLAVESARSIEILAAPATLGSFGEPRVTRPVKSSEPVVEAPVRGGFFEDPDVLTVGAAAGFFDTGVLVTSTPHEPVDIRIPGALGRPYRPKQRASLDESEQLAVATARIAHASSEVAVRAAPEPSAGFATGHRGDAAATGGDPVRPANAARWTDDPTGRHQYRYWDGTCWTESVSDGGVESRDPGVG